MGCEIKLSDNTVGRIYGESQSRVVVSLNNEKTKELEQLCNSYKVPFERIGKVRKENFIINDFINVSVSKIVEIYENTIPNIMNV